MGLADTALADQQDVVVAVYEGTRRELDDSVLGDVVVEGEVEVLQRLAVLEVGSIQSQLQPMSPGSPVDPVVAWPVASRLFRRNRSCGLRAMLLA